MKLKKYTAFGGGSCKNCHICSIPCKHPKKRLIPIEGTGINVVKLVKDIANIELKFPVEKQGYFYRVGLLLWS
jgi:predicted metal-binding protein